MEKFNAVCVVFAYIALAAPIGLAISSLVLSQIHKIPHRLFGFFFDATVIAVCVLGIIGLYNK